LGGILRVGLTVVLATLYNHFTGHALKIAVQFSDDLGFFTLQGFCKLLILLTPFWAPFTLKGAENRAFNRIENPRVGGSNPPSGTTIFHSETMDYTAFCHRELIVLCSGLIPFNT